MKKQTILFILAGVIILSFAGCKTAPGPTGPAGENLFMTNFQFAVYPTTSYTEAISAELNEANPYSIISDTGYWAGAALGTKERVLVQFGLSSMLPVNAKVVKAYLVVYCMDTYLASALFVAAYGVAAEWGEAVVTWNDRLSSTAWAPAGGQYNATEIGVAQPVNTVGKYYTWELTAATVQGWVDRTINNYGIMLKSTAEGTNGDAQFASNTHATPEYRPRLVIYYSIQ